LTRDIWIRDTVLDLELGTPFLEASPDDIGYYGFLNATPSLRLGKAAELFTTGAVGAGRQSTLYGKHYDKLGFPPESKGPTINVGDLSVGLLIGDKKESYGVLKGGFFTHSWTNLSPIHLDFRSFFTRYNALETNGFTTLLSISVKPAEDVAIILGGSLAGRHGYLQFSDDVEKELNGIYSPKPWMVNDLFLGAHVDIFGSTLAAHGHLQAVEKSNDLGKSFLLGAKRKVVRNHEIAGQVHYSHFRSTLSAAAMLGYIGTLSDDIQVSAGASVGSVDHPNPSYETNEPLSTAGLEFYASLALYALQLNIYYFLFNVDENSTFRDTNDTRVFVSVDFGKLLKRDHKAKPRHPTRCHLLPDCTSRFN
jgi:hypothetical protein